LWKIPLNFTLLSPSKQSVKCLCILGGTISNARLSSGGGGGNNNTTYFLLNSPGKMKFVVQVQHINPSIILGLNSNYCPTWKGFKIIVPTNAFMAIQHSKVRST